ncbi:hypothetical protein BDR03DRAFT_969193 [Suillus americanus]|nr:hypothetical protein BDR03DRAFT_969193 [Suillus americanus]
MMSTPTQILRAVALAFGRLAVVEASLEGEYRLGVGRVKRGSEEAAFYDGAARERDVLTTYLRLMKHVDSIYRVYSRLLPTFAHLRYSVTALLI